MGLVRSYEGWWTRSVNKVIEDAEISSGGLLSWSVRLEKSDIDPSSTVIDDDSCQYVTMMIKS